ncbi:MAG TPA: hypothetical protein VEJ00_05230, partial [Candidatus Acidoferrales bacterium]|nr:hypothetical protein [Candidatus Acidoferrales bacterium]
LATRVFEIGGGKVEIFPGNYEDYLWRKEGGQQVTPTLDDVPGATAAKSQPLGAPLLPDFGRSGQQPGASDQPTNGNHSAERDLPEQTKKRLNPIKRKQMQDRVHELEAEISRTEAAIANLEAALQNFVSAEESQRQSQELERHKVTNAALIKEWESLAASLQESE